MRVDAFIAEMNGLQSELDSLPREVTQIVTSLLELVEEQEGLIRTMLKTNKRLLDRLDE